jgi:hypothetical protein
VARQTRIAVLVGLVVALLAGCNTKAIVRIDVKSNGSGTVEVDVFLDAEAAAKVGDLSKLVQFDDLRKAGWKIEGPKDRTTFRGGGGVPKGTIEVRATRPFDNVEQANKILASISGPDGPLKGVKLTRTSSFTSTKLTAVGTVDLSKGLDAFGDSDLTKALGASVADTAQHFNGGKPADGDLEIGLQVGGLHWTGLMGRESIGDKVVDASTTLGGEPDRIDVHASQTHWNAILLALLAVLAVLGALVLTLVPLLPGRGAPPPPKRKRQRHSATDAWDYVSGREGSAPLDPKAARQAHRGRRGRHRRPRGTTPSWRFDEITVDPEERVVPRPADSAPDDRPVDPRG